MLGIVLNTWNVFNKSVVMWKLDCLLNYYLLKELVLWKGNGDFGRQDSKLCVSGTSIPLRVPDKLFIHFEILSKMLTWFSDVFYKDGVMVKYKLGPVQSNSNFRPD